MFKKIVRNTVIAVFSMFSLNQASAQLVVDTTMTPEQLVQNILVGTGVTVSNVSYSGEPSQIGSFEDGEYTNLDLSDGVILTSGNIFDIPDNCNGTVSSQENPTSSDPDLVAISGNNIRDASILEFDFIPQSDTLTFRYVFGSEEYDGYVCSSYNDAFGFFVSGPGINGPYTNNAENIAIIPGSLPPLAVAINSLNIGQSSGNPDSICQSLAYSYLYVDNCGNVGGGITKDSIPENEWVETINKTNTMKKVLN